MLWAERSLHSERLVFFFQCGQRLQTDDERSLFCERDFDFVDCGVVAAVEADLFDINLKSVSD